MSHIFISYSRKDLDFAEKIVEALATNSLDTWIDWKNIPKGEEFYREIYKGIEEADAFLFLVSPDSVQSKVCNDEIAHAIKNGKRILPIVIHNIEKDFVLNEELSKRNWIFCREGEDDFRIGVEQICKTIHTNHEWLKFHTELQAKALKWQQRQDTSRLLRGKELREVEKRLAQIESTEDPQPTDLQRQYIFISRRNEERQRNQTIVGLSLISVIMVILFVFAWIQRNEAVNQAQIAFTRQLSAEAQYVFATGKTREDTAILLAVQSMRISPSTEVAQILYNNTLVYRVAHMAQGGYVSSVAFSPDGKYVVVGGGFADKTARVWEVGTGKEIARMTHNDAVNSVAFSPDGKYVISGSNDKTARVWNAATGKEIARMTHDDRVESVAFSPDGRVVVSGSEDNTARVWDATTGKEIARMTHDGTVSSVAFSPDGKYVVSGSTDKTARVWDATNGKEIARMTNDDGIIGGVTSVAFSPDGKYIASGSDGLEGFAKVWSATTGQIITRITHTNTRMVPGVASAGAANFGAYVAFSPDGKYVVSGAANNTAHVWEAATGKEISSMAFDTRIVSVAFSPDGRYAVAGSDNAVYGSDSGVAVVWEAATGREIARITSNAQSVAFSPNGQYIVSGGNNSIDVWKINKRQEITGMKHTLRVTSIAFSPDNNYMVTGSWDRTIRLWSAVSGEEVTRIQIQGDSSFLAISPNGKYVITDANNNIWDLFTGKEVASIKYEGNEYTQNVAFAQNGDAMMCTNAGKVYRFIAASGYKVSRITLANVGYCSFSSDGKYVVGYKDKTIYVLNIATGKEISHMIHDGFVSSVKFSSDGKYVVSGSYDNTARVWETTTGKEVARMTHSAIVNSVSFSPDDKYVVSGSYDNTARVWEVATSKEITRMLYDSGVTFVAFSPDGRYVASGSEDGTVLEWLWRPDDLITNACASLPRNLTRAEWKQYIGDALPYQAVCPNLPIEPEPTLTPNLPVEPELTTTPTP